MTWTIKISSKAEAYFTRLDKDLRKRIKKDLQELAECNSPIEHRHVKPLTGELKGLYRLRVGDYRIVFALMPEILIIAIVNIAPRGDVYK
jgi:mRNA interferase RelE/StbE